MKARLSMAVLIFGLVGGIACSRKTEDSRVLVYDGLQGTAIFGGERVSETNPLLKKTVAIRFKDAEGQSEACTGAIIAPNLVLTAAHCVLGEKDQIEVIYGATGVESAGTGVKIKDVILHPQFLRRREGLNAAADWDKTNEFDMAVLRLAADLDGALPFSLFMGDAVDSDVTVAGFGIASYDLRTGRRTGDARIAQVRLKIHGSTQGNVLLADQSRGRGVCIGDSGAPVFVLREGQSELVGIVSSVRNPGSAQVCRGVGRMIRVPRSFVEKRLVE